VKEVVEKLTKNTIQTRESSKRAISTSDTWERRLGHALRNLGDRSVLNRSSLARLKYVESLAKGRYKGHLLPHGLALREIIIACIDRIASDVGNEPALYRACRYLQFARQGLTCKQIGSELGLSREHVSRTCRREAIELLAEKLRSVIRNNRQ
jgi:hypothetical protein